MFRVKSFNAFGVPNAARRYERFRALARVLEANDGNYAIVCVQECFVPSDTRCLIRAARVGGLVHWHVFRNGAGCYGSNSPGLVVFSRFQILSARFCRFALSGKPHKLHQCDGIA